MNAPGILDLLDPPLSQVEKEHGGQPMIAYNVEISIGMGAAIFPVLATDSCEAILRGLELAYPDFDSQKPAGGLRVKVVAFK